MIEILIIVGLAVVGWLVWKGQLKSISKVLGKKQATPPQKATPSAANTHDQTNAPSQNAPIAQQPEPTQVDAPVQVAEPIVEPAPQAPIIEESVTPVSAAESTAVKIPEDSILRRHYLAALQAEKDALSNPYPSDSVLRRHYEALHKIEIPRAVNEPEANQPQASNLADTKLQNDNLDQVRSEIAAELPPTPTDSVLKRHHESLLQAKLQQRLAGQ